MFRAVRHRQALEGIGVLSLERTLAPVHVEIDDALGAVDLKEIPIGGYHGAAQVAEGPALKLEHRRHHIVGYGGPAELAYERRDSPDGPDEVVHGVGLVDGEASQGTARALLLRVSPEALDAVALGPGLIRLGQDDLADRARADELGRLPVARRPAGVLAHGEDCAGLLGGGDHIATVGCRERHRLFDHDVLAAPGGLDGLGRVQGVRGGEDDGADGIVGQDIFVGFHRPAAEVFLEHGHFLAGPRKAPGDLYPPAFLRSGGELIGPSAQPNERHSDFIAHFGSLSL